MNFTGSWIITFIVVGIVLLFGIAAFYGFSPEGFEIAGAVIAVYVTGGIVGGIGYYLGANRNRGR